ncbi:MAG: DUF1772 domain-containing protein [Pseudonocardiaceae bacterium]
MTRKPVITFAVLVVLVWASMISFGAVLAETVLLYPNIFRDPPGSLVLAREFMVAGAPSDFFPPLGMAVVLSAAAASVLTWRTRPVQWWIVGAAITFICCDFVFSAVFFWPRNTIMFVDPVGTHPAEHLRLVAAQFEAGHWVRVAGAAATAALSFVGLLRFHRTQVAPTPDAP